MNDRPNRAARRAAKRRKARQVRTPQFIIEENDIENCGTAIRVVNTSADLKRNRLRGNQVGIEGIDADIEGTDNTIE